MKQAFSQLESVDSRWGGSSPVLVYVSRIIFQAAKSRVGLQFAAVRHVDRAGRDIIDSGKLVVAKGGEIQFVAGQAVAGRQRGQRNTGSKQFGKLLQQRAVVSLRRFTVLRNSRCL